MASHDASVSWTSDGRFTAGDYSRAHMLHFDGGTAVPGSSSPSVVPVPMSDPAGVDPEEALVASAAACHMLWFLSLAQAEGLDVAGYRDDASAMLGKDARGRISVTRITLRPAVRFVSNAPEASLLADLHHRAHERCFIANSLRSEILIEPQP